MRYFLIASITLHVVLLMAWTTTDLPGHNGNPAAISLLINNGIAPQEPSRQKQSASDNSEDKRAGSRMDNINPLAGIDPAASTNSKTGKKSGSQDSTRVSSDRHDNSDNIVQIATSVHMPTTGTQIQAYLMNAFIPYFTYPRLARKKGWQGTVELAVNIDAQGLLTRVRIIHSSGYGILDYAALKSIRQVKALPDAMQWLDNHGLEVNFPVKYQLIDT